jgi:hypothetical protein
MAIGMANSKAIDKLQPAAILSDGSWVSTESVRQQAHLSSSHMKVQIGYHIMKMIENRLLVEA